MLLRAGPALLLAILGAATQAAPFTPKSDNEVVESLPATTDPSVRRVESLRRQLAARPDDTQLRLEIARRYFDLAMAQGDPRFVGYALAAIGPLEKTAAGDAQYWLVRGQLQQYSHDFDGALASLDKASQLDPGNVAAPAWRAAIRMVQARYNAAETECQRLTAIADVLLARGCSAYVQATTGQLQQAYDGLLSLLAITPQVDPGLMLWLQTRLAEMATRLGRNEDAEKHFKAALATGITDQFLLGAYADFMIARGRPKDALALLAGWERSDILLLRLALAGRDARDPRAADWARQLRERFADAQRRGDRLHEQEAARFALDIEGDPARALQLATSNYTVQKEPRDAEILMRAALAAKQPAAAQPAVEWFRRNGYQDPAMQKLVQQLEAGK
jgi:predicted Zn-dependent protease